MARRRIRERLRSATRRVAASRPVQVVMGGARSVGRGFSRSRARSRSEGYTLNVEGIKKIVGRTVFQFAGGASSAVFDGVTNITKAQWDNDPLYRGLIKTGVGAGVMFLFGDKARDFTGGWNGHTAGTTLDAFVISKAVNALK